MNKTLLDIFNSAKEQCIKALLPFIVEKTKDDKLEFSPAIRLPLPENKDEYFEDITDVVFDKEENTWYVHNYITETDLTTSEYWTPLRDMSFDELYKIAEKL
jgi:hypothetical protein